MPRRPSKKTKAKKRRSPESSSAVSNRWGTINDIPLDEEDTFHASKDKILLNNEEHDGSDEDDDEVFALKGLEGDGGEDDLGDEYWGGERDEEDSGSTPPKSAVAKDKRKKKNRLEDDEEDEEEAWGGGKAVYYSSNAVQLESDDDEGHELEEQEAKRLQKLAREGTNNSDFGLNDDRGVVRKDGTVEEVVEAQASILPKLPQDKPSLLRHLEKTNPEALALARDWHDTARTLVKTRKKIANSQSTRPDALIEGMAHLHYQALLTYAATLAFYLHLRASSRYAQRPELLTSHPIMQRLLTLKQSISTIEDLGLALSDSELEFDEEDDYESLDLDDEGEDTDMQQLWRLERKKGLEPGELSDLLEDAQLPTTSLKPRIKPVTIQPLKDKPPKKKRKLSEVPKAQAKSIYDLEEPEFIISAKKPAYSRGIADLDDGYGEAAHLQVTDAADKSARKKSLRFHTAKIESTSARRQGARNQAIGGDDDIPYRVRQKEKEARLLQETTKKIKTQDKDDLTDLGVPEKSFEKRRREDDSHSEGDSDSPEGYYELVSRKGKEKKERKKAEYEATRATERILEEEGPDGPRSLTRAILTNKGLTPRRPKAVRNPRVKKRQNYDKAKKKLASQKAIYKGGLIQTGGHYEGEKSGISKVIKSVRLG